MNLWFLIPLENIEGGLKSKIDKIKYNSLYRSVLLRGDSVASVPRALRSHPQSLHSVGLRASHLIVTTFPQASGFALAFSVVLLLLALRFALTFSVALLPQALRSQKFLKKKCVSIYSKCFETHRNAKKLPIWLYMRVAQSASNEAQPYLPHVTSRVPRSVHAKFHDNWSKTIGARGIHTDRSTDSPLLCRLAYWPAPWTFRLHLQGYYSVALLPRALRFALAFSIASLNWASCFAIAFSVS